MTGVSRREFVVGGTVAGLGLFVACERLPGQAPPLPRIARIGFLSANTGRADPNGEAFLQGLREHGYAEDQSIVVEWRSPDGPDEWASVVDEMVRLPVDVIVAPSTVGVLPAKQATSTIPIVFVTVGDPVRLGLVASLAHPGGNVTGVSSLTVTLSQKRLELLKAAVPGISRIACLYDPSDPSSVETMHLVMAAAGPQAVTVEPLGVQAAGDFDRVFDAATRLPADALVTTQGPFLLRERGRIVDFAANHRLPAIYAWREVVASGGLMSYGPDQAALFRRAAYYVDRILKGTRPADLPVEQPMTFDFVVNMKTARELGITFPPEILLQVTEVIE